ncbi:MAG: hypothetical protein KAI62_08275 [Actinomycetia bacterium]|nr:hypothetical protein [Actinomycetes bacterium]
MDCDWRHYHFLYAFIMIVILLIRGDFKELVQVDLKSAMFIGLEVFLLP